MRLLLVSLAAASLIAAVAPPAVAQPYGDRNQPNAQPYGDRYNGDQGRDHDWRDHDRWRHRHRACYWRHHRRFCRWVR
ncbi:MAG: hypothetical protein ACYC8V_02765 [Caulobacteraceae bacterium]